MAKKSILLLINPFLMIHFIVILPFFKNIFTRIKFYNFIIFIHITVRYKTIIKI